MKNWLKMENINPLGFYVILFIKIDVIKTKYKIFHIPRKLKLIYFIYKLTINESIYQKSKSEIMNYMYIMNHYWIILSKWFFMILEILISVHFVNVLLSLRTKWIKIGITKINNTRYLLLMNIVMVKVLNIINQIYTVVLVVDNGIFHNHLKNSSIVYLSIFIIICDMIIHSL